jgi:uncharacterized protein
MPDGPPHGRVAGELAVYPPSAPKAHRRNRGDGVFVHALGLPGCWIGAGFVKNAVWDYLHGLPASGSDGDVGVIWFDPHRAQPAEDDALEKRLRVMDAGVHWSVKNQSRMHVRNGDAPYASSAGALRFWPETATCVAARRTPDGGLGIAAPFGLDDMVARPTPRFSEAKRAIYLDRVARKQWLRRWPRLTTADPFGRQELKPT